MEIPKADKYRGGGRRLLTDAIEQEVLRLYQIGMKSKVVQARFGVSRQTLHNIIKRAQRKTGLDKKSGPDTHANG